VQIGVIYPQTELPTDPATVRAYVTEAEHLGYHHVVVYDHVLGADPSLHAGWSGPYDIDTPFHEPFVLFGFLAGLTRMELATGIVIAPQRQTALLAKQAAEVDVLAEGRFRLGVGIGWNKVEYDSLGQDFHTRGRRLEEQVGLLRRLWTERSVSIEGHFDTIQGAGLAPRPAQRPIPIWMGAASPAAFERIGRAADGWFPMMAPGDRLAEALRHIAAGAEQAGREATMIGMEGRIPANDDAARFADKWREVGATHLSVDTMRAGNVDLRSHLEALATAARHLALA
jgi:probable F420-dependent oxidoreductase